MKKLTLLLFILMTVPAFAQTTAIPDANFEQALIDLGHDTGAPDGSVLTANISGLFYLNVGGKSISDLTGIQDFTALYNLECYNNQLTNIDLTQNSDLWYLNINNNQLTSLDLTQNIALLSLMCDENQLTSLDLTQNTALDLIGCYNNQLTSLDLTQNIALLHLDCSYNQLSCLNVKNGNNSSISLFSSNNNFSLSCIEVDDVAWSTANWTDIDAGVTFSTNCSNACSGIPTTTEEYSNQSRKLIRILDLLGRKTNFKPNTPLIYQYDDGSVEKVIREY